jgi:hypothetical protein
VRWRKIVASYENGRVGDAKYLTQREKYLLDHGDNELLTSPLGDEWAIIQEKGRRLGYPHRV